MLCRALLGYRLLLLLLMLLLSALPPPLLLQNIPPGTWKTSGVYDLMATGYLPINHKDHPAARVPYSGWVQEQQQQEQQLTGQKQPGAHAQQDGHTPFSTHGLQLVSAYFAARGAEPPLTNKHKGFAGCLDYIWISREKLRVVEVLALPYECMGLRQVPHVPEAVPFPPIPNKDWPSDHLALAAKLQWVSSS